MRSGIYQLLLLHSIISEHLLSLYALSDCGTLSHLSILEKICRGMAIGKLPGINLAIEDTAMIAIYVFALCQEHVRQIG